MQKSCKEERTWFQAKKRFVWRKEGVQRGGRVINACRDKTRRGGEERRASLPPPPFSFPALDPAPHSWPREMDFGGGGEVVEVGGKGKAPPAEGIKEHGRRNGNHQRLIVMLQTGKVASSEL